MLSGGSHRGKDVVCRLMKIPGYFTLICLVVCGCAGPVTYERPAPYESKVENDCYSATISTFSEDGLVKGFNLTIYNKTVKDIQIDWNNTLFIENESTNGTFVYEGVNFEKKYSYRKPETIWANDIYFVRIWPTNLLSYFPRAVCGTSPCWESAALDDNGQYGVYLTILSDGEPVCERLTQTLPSVVQR